MWTTTAPTVAGLFWWCDERDVVRLLHLGYPAMESLGGKKAELRASLSKASPPLSVIPPLLQHGYFAIPKTGWWMTCVVPPPPPPIPQLSGIG